MNPKDRVGATKPPMSFLPCPVLLEVGTVAALGASKYGGHNWRTLAIRASAYYDAAMRHLMQWWEGENNDSESGASHIAHAITGLMILRDAQMQGACLDDRPPSAPHGWMDCATDRFREMQDEASGSPSE